MSVTAAKWIDKQERLQFRFFLNLFSFLLRRRNLWRRNNRSRTRSQTLFNFRRNGNSQWILLHSTFTHTVLLPPEMFTRPRKDANDSLFALRPWCNAIRMRTPPVFRVGIKRPYPGSENSTRPNERREGQNWTRLKEGAPTTELICLRLVYDL